MKPRWVAVHTVGVANAVAVVDQAEAREAESWDTARDTRASGGRWLSVTSVSCDRVELSRRSIPICEVVLLFVGHLINKLSCLTIGILPLAIA